VVALGGGTTVGLTVTTVGLPVWTENILFEMKPNMFLTRFWWPVVAVQTLACRYWERASMEIAVQNAYGCGAIVVLNFSYLAEARGPRHSKPSVSLEEYRVGSEAMFWRGRSSLQSVGSIDSEK
jgi:hypothetical protein